MDLAIAFYIARIVQMPLIPDDQYRFIVEILLRMGIDIKYPPTASGSIRLPQGAAEYLTETNERLVQLRSQYAEFSERLFSHSAWNADRVNKEVPLLRFRGDSAFVWQELDLNVPISYLLTYYYLLSRLHSNWLFGKLSEDELFGVVANDCGERLLSRDLLDSVCEISALEKRLSLSASKATILDIGSGYGRLGYRLAQAYGGNISILCADAIPESTFIAEYYLGFRNISDIAKVVALPEIEASIAVNKPWVAVNIHSFSECTQRAVGWWLSLLSDHRVAIILIIPNADYHRGTLLLSTEMDGSRLDLVPLLSHFGYRRVSLSPKYENPQLQKLGVSPTHYHWFERKNR